MNKSFLSLILLVTSLLSGACSLEPKDETVTLNTPESDFWEPFGIAERNGVIFVSDGQNGRILKSDDGGSFEVFADGFHTPSHIVFDDEGRLLVVDSGSHTVLRLVDGGKIEILAGRDGVSGETTGTATESLLNGPVGVVTIGNRIIVADTYNDRIVEILDGRLRTLAGSGRGHRDGLGIDARFDTPTGLLAMPDGSLLVADSGNGLIRTISKNGDVSSIGRAGSAESIDGNLSESGFEEPIAMARDTDGSVFVLDGDSIRVMRTSPFPFVTTLTSQEGGFLDGPISESRFSRPSGIAVSSSGGILIADSDNGLIRSIGGDVGSVLAKDKFHSTHPTAQDFRKAGPARWPFEPATAPRDIAGTMGELRGEVGGEDGWRSYHNGLDIAGAYGEDTFLVRDEKVLDVRSFHFLGSRRELVRFPQMGYVHLRIGRDANDIPFDDDRFSFEFDDDNKPSGLRIRRGTKFSAGERIGTLNSQNHVHLVAGRRGYEYNAVVALDLPGLTDSIAPTISGLELVDLKTGVKLSEPVEMNGSEQVVAVVEAWDRKDMNPERRRLGVFEAGYQILKDDGSPLSGETTTISFKGMPGPGSIDLVYATGSRAGAIGITTFRYIIGNLVSVDRYERGTIDFSKLQTGDYRLKVFVTDFFGNRTERLIAFRMTRRN